MFERLAPEQYDTLPEIPEPAENPLLVGHQAAERMLAGAYRAGKLHHALLIAGPYGIGKATFAYHLAHHLLAHRNPADAPERFTPPDPASQLSRLIANGGHPAILHLTRPFDEKAKKFKTGITVEEVRRVSRFLGLKSHDGAYRIVIVDSADDMNRNAANALLKNLEEPPARTLFVLISHSPGGLLPTIRSRCQTIRLDPLPATEVAAVLKAVAPGASSDPAALGAARGSVRDAILMTEYGGGEIAEAAGKILAAPRYDPLDGAKLADAVAGRENTIQFDIFNRCALDLVAARAQAAAEAGDAGRGGRLAEIWQQARATIQESEEYNLDRRQHVTGLLRFLHRSLAG